MSRKAIYAGLLLVLLLIIAGCQKPGGDSAEAEVEAAGEEQETVFAVSTTQAVRGEIYNYIDLNGDIRAKTTVLTYPDAAGKLKRLNVSIGQSVRKNQLVAEVDPSRPGMNFAASPVKAAISGTVTSIPVEVGAMVSQQSPIVEISKMDELEIESYIAERFVSRMEEGQWALVSLDAFPGKSYSARVSELSPVVDPVSRTLDLNLEFSEDTEGVRAGMFAKIKIITQSKEDVVKVPSAAVVERFGDDYVFVVLEENRVEKRKIRPGIEIDGKQEILEGLEEGDTVVVRGQSLLEDNSPVKIVQRIEPLPVQDTIE